ncbi:MAG: alpha-acetolactate synthase [Burkholderiales bacterium]|jgi:acetolactate synthase-1/2/3 large subunit|nr:alpha-acetolactate synthase [Burkholderiales bacterium]
MSNQPINCAQAIVKILENRGITHVFGVPGAKIDSLFIALKHSKIKLVLVRHEQNAAFMAAAFGRLTGKVGVCIATSGPGVTNLVTGLATATSEGDPVLAIGGEVPVSERLKKTHQSLDSVTLMKAVTKYSAEVVTADQLAEIMGNAIRVAESGRPGASFISLPKDISLTAFPGDPNKDWGKNVSPGAGSVTEINKAIQIINASKQPLIIFGMQASKQNYADALKNFLKQTKIPYTSTFQGPGIWAQPNDCKTFVGRVGLFKNQPADYMLDKSDCVITIGYNPIEYDPSIWNHENQRKLIVIDLVRADQDNDFLPTVEILGDIGEILYQLASKLQPKIEVAFSDAATNAQTQNNYTIEEGAKLNDTPVHPLRVIYELQKIITPDTHIALDVGSNYIWMNRYYGAQYARQVLVSNGQQTLGVALPWAIATSLLYPDKRVISVSGDGGFLFSSMEMETAKRLGVKFIHLIWDSASYDMVSFQEAAHYKGDTAGVELGHYNVKAYAESFGCIGYNIKSADELAIALQEAVNSNVPVLINIPIDYSQNIKLMEDVIQNFIN